MDAAMTINGQVSPTGVTTFANEACESVEVFRDYVPSTLTVAQGGFQDLKKYFERPRLIARGSITFGTRGNIVNRRIIDGTSMPSYFPQWANRLSGVYGVRFTITLRVQVAATAFHQGLLALSWQYGDDGILVPRTVNLFPRTLSAASCTNIPHVRLDLAEDTMVELKIPFIWVNEFMPVTDVPGYAVPYGNFSLSKILPPISVVGISEPTYEMYMFLTDMEFFGADNNSSTPITLQSGVVQSELKNSHLLSDTLSNTAKVGRFVSKYVPSLAGIAGPVAWAADLAAGAARYFGYSKPLLQDPALRVIPGLSGNESNVDMPMAGSVLGLMQSNTLAVAPEFGATNVDEMALAYVLSQWSQINVCYVNTTDTHGKPIYAAPVTPATMWFRQPSSAPYCNITFPISSASLGAPTAGNVFLPSSVMYFSSLFRLWRGGLVFRFTFAKTKLHGGRYMISFNPKTNVGVNPTTYGGTVDGPETSSSLVQPYGYSMIIDLKDGNVFEFKCPYEVEVPYLTFNSASGAISMVCIDPLQSTATVTPSVPCLVEVKADSDYELADFSGNYLLPQPSVLIYQQSGVKTTTAGPSCHTIGERITSVKQLIQSPFWSDNVVAANTSTNAYLAPWYTWIPADKMAITNGIAPNNNAINVSGAGSVGGAVSKCYVFAKGGTDVHAYVYGNTESVLLDFEQVPQESTALDNSTPSYSRRSLNSSTPRHVSAGPYALHIRLPAFQQFVRVLTTSLDAVGFKVFGAPPTAFPTSRAHYDVLKVRNYSTTNPCRVIVSRSAADDAALSHYIGPSPIYIPNSTNTLALEQDWTL